MQLVGREQFLLTNHYKLKKITDKTKSIFAGEYLFNFFFFEESVLENPFWRIRFGESVLENLFWRIRNFKLLVYTLLNITKTTFILHFCIIIIIIILAEGRACMYSTKYD